jgi:CPA1 family monovalent cation:H+ antiporter
VTDWRDFKRYIRPISFLAIGLVLATSVTVAYVAHWLIGLPLAVGFVLGAIVSPTDTVATDAIAEETHMPRRIEIILNGESLVNDATGLVVYKFAIGAVLAGTFSFGLALAQFAWVSIAGIAIGVLGGELISRAGRWFYDRELTDDTLTTVITLVSPYLLYLLSDRVGASGVLAAAAGGIYLSRKGGGFYTADARIVGRAVWNTMFFLFNGALFIILGLQLRTILHELQIFPFATLALYGGVIAATVIVSRVVWVLVIANARRWFDHGIDAREGPRPPSTWTFVLGWAGMRGIVSLAAALAIPHEVAPQVPFPARDLIQFITFVTILVTLIGQGLTMPMLIRWWNVRDADPTEHEIDAARFRIAEAGVKRLESLEPSFVSPAHWEIAGKIRARYEEQMIHYRSHVEGVGMEGDGLRHQITKNIFLEVLTAERVLLAEMRLRGEVSDAIYRRLEYDIDLEESLLT